MPTRLWIIAVSFAAGTVVSSANLYADTIQVGVSAFGAGSTLTTFDGLSTGTEVNGLTVGGTLYQYSVGSGQVIIGGVALGPGPTNNVAPSYVLSVGNPTGLLTLTFPSFIDTFGYGYAVMNNITIPNATAIFLFADAVPVGSQLYPGAPDPLFTGGFAGIQSTVPFNRAQLSFNPFVTPAFAVDNVRTALVNPAAVPEPTTLMLLGTGLFGLVRARVRAKSRTVCHRRR